MSKLLILKGLPASGKSTYAKDLVKKGWKRVNKDDLRDMIDNNTWSKEKEKYIVNIEQFIVAHFLASGFNVVVDDTNFAWEDTWKQLATNEGSDYEVKFFDVPVMECVARDAKRGDKSIGAKPIFRMYNQYLKPKPPEWSIDKQNCYIFDIDGTLAEMNGRSPYDYTKVDTDLPRHNITMIARVLSSTGLPIILLSGRQDDCREQTTKWLQENNIPFDKLLMRKSGDIRNDAIIKREIYENEIKPYYNVLAVFDDRNRVVDMWRSLGLDCLQVNYGNF